LATKRNRNGRWHYQIVRKNLLPKPIYLAFDDEAEGDQYVAQLEKLIDAGRIPDEFKQGKFTISTIAEAIDGYLEAQHIPDSDQLLLKVIRERKGHVKLEKIDYVWSEQYVDEMKAANKSPSTIRHHVGALARCFDWVEKRGDTMLMYNPLRKLPRRYATGHKEEFERDRRLSIEEEAEVLRILKGGKPVDRERSFLLKHPASLILLFTLAIETGMRMREIYTLTSDQVDFEKRTIFLEKTKNGDKRQVPLSTVAIKALKDYFKFHKEYVMFPWTGEDRKVTGLLSQQFGRVFEAAGCGEFTFHGCRHEATCRLYERTKMTDVQIGKALGWRSLKMALRYANLRGSDLADLLW